MEFAFDDFTAVDHYTSFHSHINVLQHTNTTTTTAGAAGAKNNNNNNSSHGPRVSESVAAKSTQAINNEVTTTTAAASVTRGYEDLDHRRFLAYAFLLCAGRTAAQQPLNLALARKQTCAASSGLSTGAILRSIFRGEGGWRALGRGMAAMTLGCALSEVIYLTGFEYGRARLPLESSVARDAASGYAADALCRLVHIPLTIIAFRQMVAMNSRVHHPRALAGSAAGAPLSALGTLRSMWREGGLRSTFAGFSTTLLVGCQWSALWWSLYGYTKERLYQRCGPWLAAQSRGQSQAPLPLPLWCTDADDNVLLNSAASVFTSGVTAVLFNPYLVIRTNLQVAGGGASLLGVTRALWQTRGLRGFYSGVTLSVAACIVDGALASTSYEYAKLWSDVGRTRREASAPAPAQSLSSFSRSSGNRNSNSIRVGGGGGGGSNHVGVADVALPMC